MPNIVEIDVSKHDAYQRRLAPFLANALKYYRQYLKGLLHSGLAKAQTLGGAGR